MTRRRLIVESLKYYWRSHAAVLLCVAIASSVLGGALLVGDSMRGSLRDITLDRLGQIDFALSTSRLVGRDLGDRIASTIQAAGGFHGSQEQFDPMLLLRGSVARVGEANRETARASRVQICGVTAKFWDRNPLATVFEWTREWDSSDRAESIVLNDELARELEASVGDTVIIRIEKPSDIPREAALGRKDDSIVTRRLSVSQIVSGSQFGNFRLEASQRSPRNAFLPLDWLATAVGHDNKANTVLASALRGDHAAGGDPTPQQTDETRNKLQAALASCLQLNDLSLRLRTSNDQSSLVLESGRLVLEPAVANAVQEAARELNGQASPVVAYLANSVRVDGQPARMVPYSTIAGVGTVEPPAEAFHFRQGDLPSGLGDFDILLNAWIADDLACTVGDSVIVEYYVAEPARPFETAEATFRVRGIVEMQGLAADSTLVPEYPGITNAKRYADWDPPFPMDLKRIRPKDEEYWDMYRATPKAFVALATAERLWGSRFGKWTSIRFQPEDTNELQAAASGDRSQVSRGFEEKLLARIRPEQIGLTFEPVWAQGLAASKGGTDFGGLFIGFSLFLIVSAAILIGLVFRLGVERRGRQVGLLLALGYPRSVVSRLLVVEGLLVAVVGTLLGVAGAIGYGWLVMTGLRTWWFAAVGTSLLRLHVTSTSLAIAAVAGVFLAGVAVVLSLRGLARAVPRSLMAGSVGGPARIAHRSVKVIRYAIVALLIVGIGGALVLEATGQFFVLGSVMLLAALGWVAMRLYAAGQPVRTAGVLAIARLGVRNASRNGSRSLLTVGLVAFATFVIVAIGANRRDENAPERLSKGSWIVAESSVPLLYDLNTAEGRRDLGIPDDNGTLVKDARVYRLRAKQGEDASCLNLYQPKSPRILGIPDSTLRELHFVLGGSQADFPGSQAIQHKLLQTELGTDVIPAMGDANSVRWILHLGLGDRLPITADDGRNMELQIVSLLDRSVFQSELIISESNFQRLFPSQVGYSVFMIDPRQSTTSGPPGHDPAMPRVGTMLEEYLSDYGFDVNLVAERVAEYHAVENTYLATFQLLGGLGLMLGTLGLGAVVLRGVIERRGELALLMAVGYRSRDLAWMVLAETAYLLIAGLVVGSISAAVAVAPHLYQYRFEVPWGSLVITLLLVLAAGLLSSTAAVLATVRTPLLPALRSE